MSAAPSSMSGVMPAYRAEWKHADDIHSAINRRYLALGRDDGDDWTPVDMIVLRGGTSVRLPSGDTINVGSPFPRGLPGIYEAAMLCGEEQALSVGYSFAAHVASLGGKVSIRVVRYSLKYNLEWTIAP